MISRKLKVALLMILLMCTNFSINNVVGAENERPIVVELFTSQGCPSCPPADKFIGELAKEEAGKILALSFHVDYWDKNGWKDPFSSPYNTGRQENYAANFKLSSLYTPQAVIDGIYYGTGSRRDEVRKNIKKARNDMENIPVKIGVNGGEINILVGSKGDEIQKISDKDDYCDIFLISFDREHVTKIYRGENIGRMIKNTNVVKGIYNVGQWNSAQLSGSIDLSQVEKSDAIALIVQEKYQGRIKGAGVYYLK